nr:MAG TPA: hypothetical protein [Caudoviricetes sp.]
MDMKRTLGEELYRMKKGRYPSLFYKIMMRIYLNLDDNINTYLLILICLLQLLLVILVCR